MNSGGRLHRWAVPAAASIIVAACLAAFASGLHGAFIYDDTDALVENPSIRSLWPLARALFPRPGISLSGRPLLALSFALNYAAGGLNPWGYHAANIAIHACAALFLFGIVRRTLALSGAAAAGWAPRRKLEGRDATLFAAAVALVWAVHPLQAESVTYVIQRAESMAGMFFLAALYCFIRSIGSSGGRHGMNAWGAGAVGACLLGVATKELVAVAPVLIVLYDRIFAAGSFRESLRRRWRLHLGLFATWVPLLALLASQGWNRNGEVGFGIRVSPWAYWLTQPRAIERYLALSVWPHPLVFDYGTFFATGAASVVPYALIVVPVLAAALLALRFRPAAGFLGAWFFLILAPTSILPGTTQMIVEHRMYLPLAAVVLLAAGLAWTAAGRAGLWALACAALVLGALTSARNRAYSSELELWTETAAQVPDNPDAAFGRANALLHLDRIDDALAEFQTVVRLAPGDAFVRNNYANALFKAGRISDALAQIEAARRIKPDDPLVRDNYGIILCGDGRYAEAIAVLENADTKSPSEFARIHAALGQAHLRLGHLKRAIENCTEATYLDPSDEQAQADLAEALCRAGRSREALVPLAAWSRLDPESEAAHGNYGTVLLGAGCYAEAEAEFRAVLRLRPDSAAAHLDLGNALAGMGRTPEARAEFKEALRIDPALAGARSALAKLGQP